MMDFSRRMPFFAGGSDKPTGHAHRVGFVDGVLGNEARVGQLGGLFPNVGFESVGPVWPEHPAQHLDILFVPVDGSAPAELMEAARRLKARTRAPQIVVCLANADAANTRLLAREGASDVLPSPVGDAALALSIERLLAREGGTEFGSQKKPGQVVALLKAGGGVGATALGVQVAAMLAQRRGDRTGVCFADFDLQFGAAALYLDIREALTVSECLPVGDVLEETQFATELATHSSGARLLAAPLQLTPLDALTPNLAEGLIYGLKRDFSLTIVDMPSVWTQWTNRLLQLCDRIVLVTQLTVPHVHLARKQLGVLALQKLDTVPLTLVCNALSSAQQKALALKAAQRAIGKDYSHVIPEDRDTMIEAINRGLPVSTVRRGTKLEKAIAELADAIAADALTAAVRV